MLNAGVSLTNDRLNKSKQYMQLQKLPYCYSYPIDIAYSIQNR